MHFNDKHADWMNDKALELFKEGESITSVCCDLGITRETYYQWAANKEHPFYETAKHGELQSQQYWERIGRKGITGQIDKFAGSSWQFVLKNRFRDSYTDQQPQNSASDTLIEKLLEKL